MTGILSYLIIIVRRAKEPAAMETTRMSSRGQVVLPQSIRESLGLEQGTVFEVRVEEGKIVLQPLSTPSRGKDWRRWMGGFRGSRALQELIEEHREEVERDG